MYEERFIEIEFKEKLEKLNGIIDNLGTFNDLPKQPEVEIPIPKENQSEDWLHPESIEIFDKKTKEWKDTQPCKICGFYFCNCEKLFHPTFLHKLKNKIQSSAKLIFYKLKDHIYSKVKAKLHKIKLRLSAKALLNELQLERYDLSNECLLRKHYQYMEKYHFQKYQEYSNRHFKQFTEYLEFIGGS